MVALRAQAWLRFSALYVFDAMSRSFGNAAFCRAAAACTASISHERNASTSAFTRRRLGQTM
jgi:hypothetical protein